MKSIHILGICGTFMAGVAVLAKQQGMQVSGADLNVYPPMSTQLAEQGIECVSGYQPEQLKHQPECVVIGNAMKRGNPVVEAVLDQGIAYTSGPQWLFDNILKHKHVLAISGTHGKTTTASMLAHILEVAGLAPGFLIGGVPENFGVSARLTDSNYFVIEADEYDSAFFDKRSKFIHYHPRTLVINNLEFDHADIFADLAAIQKQFHYCVRTVPASGCVIHPADDQNVQVVIEQGCWSRQQRLGHDDNGDFTLIKSDGSAFRFVYANESVEINWSLLGTHNVRNACMAMLAAMDVGVSLKVAGEALASFKSVKRRMQVISQRNAMTIYDDFAHHPTAIATTLAGLRQHVGDARVIAVLECRSFSMRSGIHKGKLAAAFVDADLILIKLPEDDWGVAEEFSLLHDKVIALTESTDLIIENLTDIAQAEDHIVIMSNGGFDQIYAKLPLAIANR